AAAPPEDAAKVRREVMERAEASIPALDAETTPAWLRTACDEVKKLKPPSWVTPEDLPPILVDGRKLNEVQGKAVFATLAKSPLRSPQAHIAALKAHADRRSLDAFAWALFQRWLAEGAPAKEKCAMAALGLLGSDDALMQLNGIAQKLPFKGLKAKAT